MLISAIHTGFYAAVAQILPIFLLLEAVGETRLRAKNPRPDALRSFLIPVLFPVMMIIVGELFALRVLLSGEETAYLRSMTCAAVSIALASAVMRLVHAILSDFDLGSLRGPPRHFWLVTALGMTTATGSYAILTVGV